ncbi:hypothetical protein NL676_030574 [Syzygium grande]|nr:hypothetical protein NL676_030574 [Syzygium grande]
MQRCLMPLHSNVITPELDEALQKEIQPAFHKIQRANPQTSQDGDVGRNEISHEMLWKGVPKFFANGAYNVLHVNNLHRILEIKGPLLMWCSSPLQALASCYYLAKVKFQNACRKTACAGGSVCEVKHKVMFVNKITI